jgi:preprotein translocase YajC subunit
MNDAEILSVVFVAVLVAFYLMFLRPIQKDQEKHRQQIRDLRVGDEVLTTSNFVAKIRDIQVPAGGQSRITLEIADGVVVTALPAAILQRLSPAAAVARSDATVSSQQEDPTRVLADDARSETRKADAGQAASTGSRHGESPPETGQAASTGSRHGESPTETGQVQA